MRRCLTLLFLLLFMLTAAPVYGQENVVSFLFPTFSQEKLMQIELILSEFKKARPDITVEMIPGSSAKLATMIAGGVPPDLAWHGGHFPTYQMQNQLMPLDEFIQNDPDFSPDVYFDVLWDFVQYDGKVTALPYGFQTFAIAYNKDLFLERGLPTPARDWTWDDVLEYARRLTYDATGDGEIDHWGITLSQVYERTILRAGGDLIGPDGRARTENEATIAMMELYKAMHDVYRVHPYLSQVQGGFTGLQNLFMNGNIGMYGGASWVRPPFRTMPNLDWDVAMWPILQLPSGGSIRNGAYEVELFAITRGARNPEGAWELLKFLAAREESMMLFGEGGYIIPSMRSAALSPVHLDPSAPPANARIYLEMLDYSSYSFFRHPGTIEMDEAQKEPFNRFMNGEISAREATRQIDRILERLMAVYAD